MKNRFRTALWLVLLFASLKPAGAQQLRTEFFRSREVVSQEILVRFRGPTPAQRQASAPQDSDIVTRTPLGRTGALRLQSRGRNVETLLQAYASRPDVEYAEPNYVWHATDLPNDPFFPEQWALKNTGQQVPGRPAGTAGADIKAVEAWDVTEGSRSIVVGMLDTGIDYNHPDLAANVWSAPSAFSVTISGQTINCPAGTHGFNAILRNCDPKDDDGHGTSTAGIVGAAGNNAFGLTGVSRVASLIGLKFLSAAGAGTTADAVAAIEFAVQVKNRFPTTANIRVLNASWGGDNFSQLLLDEINLAGSNGMLFVTAAGNNNQNLDTTVDYPASYNSSFIIAVAATDNRDQKASFSNFGATSVDLGAPGVDVSTTTRNGFYSSQSGTSSAAPMVSGAAALVLSACSLSVLDLKSNLMGSVDAIPSLSGITVAGGRLNVNSAVRNCVGTLPPTFTLTALPRGQTIALGHVAEFNLSLPALNGFSDSISLSIPNLPQGMTADFSPQTLTGGSSTLTITTDVSVPTGNYMLNIVATGGGITRTAAVVVTSGLPVECTVVANTSEPSYSGNLSTSDAASIHRPSSFADYCVLTVEAERAVTVTLSNGFDSYLYLLSSAGDILNANDTFLSGDAGFSMTLAPGDYFLELTSTNPGETGNYTLRLQLDSPILTTMSPDLGVTGTSVDVAFTGTKFLGSPFDVEVTGCPGTTVSDVVVVNTTTATARLNLANNIGFCSVRLRGPGGPSDTRSFRIIPPPPTITSVSPAVGVQGQTVPITITGSNFIGGVMVQWRTPTGFLEALNTRSVTATTITLDLTIALFREPGAYAFIVSTNGGISNAGQFDVIAAPPVISSLNPAVGGPGLSRTIVIFGTSFTTPFQINAGPDIQVTNAVRVASNRLEATFTVAPTAAFGDYPVTVTTSTGTSAALMYSVIPPPTITSISPQRAFLGRSTTIVVSGTNFLCSTEAAIDGIGVTTGVASPTEGNCSSTSRSFVLVVSSSAPLGLRNLTVAGPNGSSNAVTINIVPVPPIISNITPPYAAQGTSSVVVVAASDLNLGTISVNVSGTGVQVTNQTVNGSSLILTLDIAGNATVGARNLTVTNSQGESDPVIFSVTPPTWPDLAVTQVLPSLLGSGFEEISVISVRNVGTKETTLPVTVTATLSYDGLSASTTSVGWVCSMVARTATCTNPLSIAVNSERVLELKITMPLVDGFFSSVVEVNSVEDYNLSNNKASNTSRIESPGVPRFVISPPSLQPGQQATLSLTINTPFPHDLFGTVTLSFTSSPPGGAMDPAVQFATGGQTVGYIIRAFSTQAQFNGGQAGPIGFQTGTVAGNLIFTATYQGGTRPAQSTSTTASVAAVAPRISTMATEKTATGFVAAFTLFSPSRRVNTLSFQFNASPPIRLSCGNLSSCSASGSTVTFQVQPLFNTWYANNTDFGSIATVRVPFTTDGTLSGTVSMTVTNETGPSNTMSFTIP